MRNHAFPTRGLPAMPAHAGEAGFTPLEKSRLKRLPPRRRRDGSLTGFTLIETVVYLAIYAIIMTGALVSVYALFGSSARNQMKALAQEEGSFLIAKIDWALTGVQNINNPPAGSSGNTLSITKYDATVGNPIVFTITSGGNMTIGRAGNPMPPDLNNSNVHVTCPPAGCFVHNSTSGDGINPESITAFFTVHATTSEGLPFAQDFTTVKFLRK